MSEEFEVATEGITVVIDFSHKINIIRFLGNSMRAARLNIRAEVVPTEYAEEIDFDITFAKIKFWLETIVNGTIAFSRANTTALEMMFGENNKPKIVNHLMVTPFEPTDEHLASLLQAKMAALSGGKITFGCVRIQTENSNGLVFTYVGEWEEDLPEMKDWYPTTPYYFETPWWTRDDVSTLDIIIGEIQPDIIPAWAFNLDFLENSIRPKPDHTEEEVVIKGSFQPKIIDGGRDED
jgi:hypothetical protein